MFWKPSGLCAQPTECHVLQVSLHSCLDRINADSDWQDARGSFLYRILMVSFVLPVLKAVSCAEAFPRVFCRSDRLYGIRIPDASPLYMSRSLSAQWLQRGESALWTEPWIRVWGLAGSIPYATHYDHRSDFQGPLSDCYSLHLHACHFITQYKFDVSLYQVIDYPASWYPCTYLQPSPLSDLLRNYISLMELPR